MKRILSLLICVLLVAPLWSQDTALQKLSSLPRRLLMQQKGRRVLSLQPSRATRLCAFVKVEGNAQKVLEAHGCRYIDQIGSVTIAEIPLNRLSELAGDALVKRIEAHERQSLQMDSTAMHVNAMNAYSGLNLPQPYTGKGVVVGVQDVGFDLTHPNFFDATTNAYRIKRLWDQLAPHEEGCELYVGREYITEEALLSAQHTTDGLIETHGTHTAGTAAGSGYGTPYRGMAWESDLCLVANAVSSNASLIPEEDLEKYTYTTDVLGFKYIFDYAESVGKPCVASFSEGSYQDFRGDDQLYYEALGALVGKGRILVASAGNDGWKNTYMHKAPEQASVGTYLQSDIAKAIFTLEADAPFTLRFRLYAGGTPEEWTLHTSDVMAAEDQHYTTTWTNTYQKIDIDITAYTSCYDATHTVYDVCLQSDAVIGTHVPLSVELVDDAAEVQLFNYRGYLINATDPTLNVVGGANPAFNAAESRYSVLSPGSAPDVICVGATAWRNNFINSDGQTMFYNKGLNGQITDYSASGPTYDNRMKPDIVAPGTNIISSYSSFYLANTTRQDMHAAVARYTNYPAALNPSLSSLRVPWAANSGTSMSTPVVAGVIALWLQANPKLTPEDVKNVFAETAHHGDESLTYPNEKWGYGEIDAYRGLLKCMEMTGISTASTSHLSPLTSDIYTLDGRKVNLSLEGGAGGGIPKGIYISGGRKVVVK